MCTVYQISSISNLKQKEYENRRNRTFEGQRERSEPENHNRGEFPKAGKEHPRLPEQRLTDAEKLAIANYWSQWKEQPTATIVKASDLTEAQKKEFIIKDNVGFGDWDTDMLNNGWNTDLLKDWGIESWKLQGWGGTSNSTSGGSSQQEPDETESSMGDTPDELPIELQGKDLTPDDLPKIEGDDKTAMERIIITFKSEERDYLAALLGLASIDKVLYSVDELKDKNGSEN